MDATEEETLRKDLKELVPFIIDFTNKTVTENKLVPKRKQQYVSFTVESIEYDKNGLKINKPSGKLVERDEVDPNIMYLLILPAIQKSDNKRIQEAKEILKKYGQDQYADNFITTIISETLKKPDFKLEEADKKIDLFVTQLKEGTLHFTSKVEMYGIILSDDTPITLNLNGVKFILRRPRKEDLEFEDFVSKRLFSPTWALTDIVPITLIIEANMDAQYGQYIQHIIMKLLTALRLYGVGSVSFSRYNINTEAVAQIFYGGTFSNRIDTFNISNRYEINHNDTSTLEQFCLAIFSKLSDNGDVGGRLDYKNFAFQRYTESLTKQDIHERRIADAVMGLESLYLNANSELSFRICTLVSKVIGLLGYDDPFYARSFLIDAYNIRSTFIHGNLLSEKARNKLIENYKSEDAFLSKLLDYLRVSVILYLTTVADKDSFIALVTDSLVDKKKEEELVETHIKPTQQILTKK